MQDELHTEYPDLPIQIIGVAGTRAGIFTSSNLATAFATLHVYNPAAGTIQPLNLGTTAEKSSYLIANLNENQSAGYRALFEEHGVTPDRTVVAYCNTGYRSAHAYLALVLAIGHLVGLVSGEGWREEALAAARRADHDSLARIASDAVPVCYYKHAEVAVATAPDNAA